MPRKRQPKADFPNQPYGRGQALGQMQQDGPSLPNGGAPQGVPGGRGATRDDLLNMATQFAGPLPQPLGAPTTNPGEHVMTGVAGGPGGGPEVLYGGRTRPSVYADTLEEIAASIPDPFIRRLAQRARARS